MKAEPDPFEPYQGVLIAELRRTLEGLSAQHAALLRQQLTKVEKERQQSSNQTFLPALLCLLTADAVAAEQEAALPGATSIALLALMTSVFDDIAGEGSPPGDAPLLEAWGMPRTLNAGDAFFVTAQNALAGLQESRHDEGRRVEACRIIDAACRGLAEELYQAHLAPPASPLPRPSRSLVDAALRLGGLIAGAGPSLEQALAEFAGDVSAANAEERLERAGMNAEGRQLLVQAMSYIERVG